MCYPGETDTPQCTNHHGTSIKKKWNKKKRHHCTRVGEGPQELLVAQADAYVATHGDQA